MKNLIHIAIILLGLFMSSCGNSQTFQMDNSQNPLYYHDAYWVTSIKPEGAPAKITVINDMHIDTSTNRVTSKCNYSFLINTWITILTVIFFQILISPSLSYSLMLN